MASHRQLALAVLIGAMLATAPQPAMGAACCMSATATGIGRLLIWERFAVGLRSSIAGGVGRWDHQAQWHSYDESYREIVEWRSELWTIVGLGRRWSLYGRLPWLLDYRHVGNLGDSVDGGLADVQAGARYELLSIGEYLRLPAVAFTMMVTFPTGRTVEAAGGGGSGVTSRGAWVLSCGTTIEKTYLPWFVRLDLGASVPFQRERENGTSQRYGVGVGSALSGGYELIENLVASLTARFLWEDKLVIDGQRIDNSARSDFGLGLAFSWRFDPHWTVQAGLDTGVFVSALGDNTPGRLTGTFGVRYGYF